ncbi:hypothetical protein A3K93_05130 [Acinetobacter sp. NCu2D-2]|uniref:prepilin-type N-terminal cleavage/methylation domain-containing protein n=1 Tax=Acinetobacter sp. NCu2D-2 TaxID=1608473 RepID=UPI0007CDC572|nr:hypothetical protein [Acinetobacter sp. NCu2D-2]ANF81626.1 hypothetical protein A3K93_05130 [Acinetobacter sp. NCu2D-2]
MKHIISINKAEHGMGLLEALIAVLLSSIVILGAIYSSGRTLVAQRQNNMQYIVVNQLRFMLQNATASERQEWCAGKSHPEIVLPKEKHPYL